MLQKPADMHNNEVSETCLQAGGHGTIHEQDCVVHIIIGQAKARRVAEHARDQLHTPLLVHEPHVLHLSTHTNAVSTSCQKLLLSRL